MKQWIIILVLFFTGLHNNVQASSGKDFHDKSLSDSNAIYLKIIFDQQDEYNLYLDDRDFDFYDSPADFIHYISFSLNEGREFLRNHNPEFSLLDILLPNLLDLPPPSDF
jgi:hypothetical protein